MSPAGRERGRHVSDGSGPCAFTWAVWAVMLAIALYYFVTATSAIPLSEDRTLVPAVTGHERHLLSWLWSQNNEHRVPLPRLILLLVLRAAHANFRSGMLLNIGLMLPQP